MNNFILIMAISILCIFSVEAFDIPQEGVPLPQKLQEAIEEIDFERYDVRPQSSQYGYGFGHQAALPGWTDFTYLYGQQWQLSVDSKTNGPLLIQGQGIPWVPGKGNSLSAPAFGPGMGIAQENFMLEEIADVAQAFIAENQQLLQVGPDDLVLDEKISVGFGKKNRYWSVQYQYVYQDPGLGIIPVRGASLFFRVNHGNLIQFGNRLAVVPQGINTDNIISEELSLEKAMDLLGNPGDIQVTYPVKDLGQSDKSLQIVPYNDSGGSLGHQLVRSLNVGTESLGLALELWFDAHTGDLVYAVNRILYVDASVHGGIYPETNLPGTEVLRNMPFLTVVNNGINKTTDMAGTYDYNPPGSLATASLEGDYIRIDDNCGNNSVSISFSPGDISFGMGMGTDCATPGFGGPGNTHAARSSYFHLNLIKEKARKYLNEPMVTTPWLDLQLIANVNETEFMGDPLICNAFWWPPTGQLHFFQAGGGCSNTGEIASVFLHEFGHGLDENTGGPAPEMGSGEAYGDTMAFLQTHSSCIGHNFRPGVSCDFGCDATCTGVRDVNVDSVSAAFDNVTPANIDVAPADCDRWACPYFNGPWPYQGPMGYEGHCESLIASGAVWDMIEGFVARYGEGAGWALADRIWYESLYDTGSAYQLVDPTDTCNPAADINGCGADNWYTVFLALDDDNGDLTDGTPNAGIIWNAFNDHGIACGATAPPESTICPALGAPVLTAVPATGQVQLDWTAITDAASYRIFRNSLGCHDGSIPIAEVNDPTITYTDTEVMNGITYYYAVQAIGADDDCVSEFSNCEGATPPAPLLPANIFMVLDQSGSMSGATEVAGEQKIDALIDASHMVVDIVEDYASDGFRIGAFSFSTTVTGNTGGLKDPSNPGDLVILNNFIDALTPTNLTAIGLGINAATGAFPSDGKEKIVMLLSNGMQNVTPYLEVNPTPPLVTVGGVALPADIRFYTVALGTHIQEDLFDDLANQGGIPGFYYSGGTTDIQNNFAFWIADVLGLSLAGPSSFAPRASALPASYYYGTDYDIESVTFYVNETVRRVTFLLTWQEKGRDLRFYLETPLGQIQPPSSSFHPARGYASYTVHMPIDYEPGSHVGEWILYVYENFYPTYGIPSNYELPEFNAHALFDDPALSIEYIAGGEDPGAGESLPLEVRVLENGNPVSGLNVKAVIEGPEEGLGELLSESTTYSIGQINAFQPVGGDPFHDLASQKLALLMAEDPNFIKILPGNVIQLVENIAGFYQAELPAYKTSAAGTYKIAFEVEGQGMANDYFNRTQSFSRYLRLKPTVENTDVSAVATIKGDLQTIQIILIPRDRLGKRLGPGWGEYINAFTDIGYFKDEIQDNLDGSYTLLLIAPVGTDPKVTIEVRGELIVDSNVFKDIHGNMSPVADAGPDRNVFADANSVAQISLDGSNSYDPDGDPLTYEWTWTGGSASGVNPTVILPVGTTTITLTISDLISTDTDTVVITVEKKKTYLETLYPYYFTPAKNYFNYSPVTNIGFPFLSSADSSSTQKSVSVSGYYSSWPNYYGYGLYGFYGSYYPWTYPYYYTYPWYSYSRNYTIKRYPSYSFSYSSSETSSVIGNSPDVLNYTFGSHYSDVSISIINH
ncbi:MAG: PKD domain-containing protein [bacterium]